MTDAESLSDDLLDRVDDLLGRARDGLEVGAEIAALPAPARNLLATLLGRAPQQVSGGRVGPYALLRELGRGGQASVWLAHDERLARRVAIKVFHRDVGLSTQGLERIRREALAASRLQHPGICPVHDTGSDGDQHFIVMSWLDGETLASRIAAWRARAAGDDSAATAQRVRAAVTIAVQVARAAHAAHEANVVHRDLKPGNIMLLADDRPVVLDFGLAHVGETGTATLTLTGQVFGTPAYMSPEQVEPHGRRLDARTDVWSLGVTLYEAIALRRPFDAPTPTRLADAILHREPASLRELRGVGADLAVVVATALEKDLGRRYGSMAAFADDLAATLDHRPVAARPIGPLARALRWMRRRPAQAALVAVAFGGTVGIGGLSGYLLAHRSELRHGADLLRRQRVDRLLDVGFFEVAHGQDQRARAVLDDALREEPHLFEAVLGLWLSYARGGDAAGARAALTAHADALPAGLAARLDASLVSGQPIDVAGTTDPHLLFAAGVAELARTANDWSCKTHARAVDRFTNCLLASRESRRLVLFLRAQAAAFGLDFDTCAQTVAYIESNWAGLPESEYWAGVASLDVDAARAEAAFRRALQLDPTMLVARRQLARLRARTGDRTEALRLIEACIAERPTDAENFRYAAEVREILRDPDGLEAAARRALELDPAEPVSCVMLSTLLLQRGDDDEALALLRRGAERSTYPGIQINLGAALRADGDVDGAMACWRKVIDGEVRNPQFRCVALGSVALVELDRGRFAAGFGHLAAAVRVQTDVGERAARWLPPVEGLLANRDEMERIEREFDRWLATGALAARPQDGIEVAVRRGEHAAALRLADAVAWPVGVRDRGRAWTAIAALAVSGQAPDPQVLRTRAHGLLRDELDGRAGADGTAAGTGVEITPAEWATVPEFAPVRDEAGLASLPADEQARWRALFEAAARG